MNKKKGAAILSAALIAASLTGCAGKKEESPENTQVPQQPAFAAERTTFSELQEGDRFLIVCPEVMRAISSLTAQANISGVRVIGDETVITQVPEYTLSFTCEKGTSGIYLKSDAGYLTADVSGWHLSFTSEKQSGSEWIAEEGGYLYNPDVSLMSEDEELHDFCLAFRNEGRLFYTCSKAGEAEGIFLKIFPYVLKEGSEIPEDDGLGYRLPVFETADIHGYLAEIYDGETYYLYSWIADKINDSRNRTGSFRTDTTVLLDAGDIYQGNTMSDLLRGSPFFKIYEQMEYDAVTIGNHEFDWGISAVTDPDQTMPDYKEDGDEIVNDTPVVMSNLYQNGEQVPFAKDYVILEKTAIDENGRELPVRIGVIGYSEDYGSLIKSSLFADLGYEIKEDPARLERMAQKLKNEEGCQAVILLTHTDPILIADALGDTAIDLLLGGHKHMDDAGETASGLPYLMPEGLGEAYCYAELVFDADATGKAVYRKTAGARTVSLDSIEDILKNPAKYPEEMDEDIVQISDASIDKVEGILNEKIGYITVNAICYDYFPESGERGSTCGNWVTSMIARACDADLGVYNRFGLRADFRIPKGSDRLDITTGDVYTLFPFSNCLYCYQLSADELLEVLQFALTPGGTRLMAFISGLTVYYGNGEIYAILRGDELLYDHGVWTGDHQKDTFRLATNDYVGTTEERDGDKNPLFRYNDPEHLVIDNYADNESVLKVLKEEAAKNNGHLEIDTRSYFIRKDYVKPQ